MRQFSIPYNNRPETLDRIATLLEGKNGKKIRELYFSGPPYFFGCGRAISHTTTKKLVQAIKFCHEHGIGANLLLNSGCGGIGWYAPQKMNVVLKYLKKIHAAEGLDAVTVTDPIYLQRIRVEFPDITIATSAFSEIDSLERAKFYKKFGADVITPNGINRNLELLKEIKEETGLELRLMANEGCIHNCPYRIAHINYTSHASQKKYLSQDECAEHCVILKRIDPTLLLKSDWIRPEDIKKYRGITEYFKIVGRTMDANWMEKTVSAYLNENYSGNLLELLESTTPKLLQQYGAHIENSFLDGFFEKLTSCNRKCHTCNYCNDLAKKAITFTKG